MSVLGEFMAQELRSQPETWERTLNVDFPASALPQDGERIAVIGCGSSWFGGQVFASLRETLGRGETDAFTASEFPAHRDYDRIIAISRSGTTTEVVDALERLGASTPVTALVGAVDSPIATRATDAVALDFADERSVVQTRFATSVIAAMRSWLGQTDQMETAIRDAESVLAGVSPDFSAAEANVIDEELIAAEQFSFLGLGWTWGLANEAALKLRESAQAWTESYSSMEYRHGPIAIAAPGRVTWQIGDVPAGLREQVEATGARFLASDRDPLAELVRVHALALVRARRLGVDPDRPRSLSRSVVLDG
ncbi:SIS domain-containing protein [Brevibacterium marinum]|uniref:Fructoselysine-6-P-deglycase FrlB-like protein n=1 Tax=Brevibacterium marinum TaxID=418643 RepID=A0A846RPJ0_9MICO|nr:SIS domain-containing protein [Brevibacterium marinum]NJC55844.1 fructoselysine-6-P-deglycase FrlB-like protein [Brevibacterium marinum]